MFCGEVTGFGRIVEEVVDFPLAWFFLMEPLADGFELWEADGGLSAVFREDPDHGLGASEFGAGGEVFPEADAVEFFRWGEVGGSAEGGEPVGEPAWGVRRLAGGDFAGEADDSGDAEAAFVERSLVTAEVGGGVEEPGVAAADVEGRVGAWVGGAVIGGEDDQGGVEDLGFFESGADGTDVAIEVADHGGVGGAWSWVGEVAGVAEVGLGVPVPGVWVEAIEGWMHGHVWLDEGEVEEERLVLVVMDEGFGFADHGIGRVVSADEGFRDDGGGDGLVVARDGGLVEGDFLIVAPEVGGVVGVGEGLAVVAEEEVEALAVGIAGRADRAESPFADGSGAVAILAKDFGEGDGFVLEGVLALVEFGEGGRGLAIAADFGMAEVFAGEEGAACGGADGSAGEVLGEACSFAGEAVEVRGLDLLLAEAAEFAVAEVICDDENDVEGFGLDGGEEGEEKGAVAKGCGGSHAGVLTRAW